MKKVLFASMQLSSYFLILQLGSGFVIAETSLATNTSLSKLFFECKDYIVAACQGKIWVEKIDDMCQVYTDLTKC